MGCDSCRRERTRRRRDAPRESIRLLLGALDPLVGPSVVSVAGGERAGPRACGPSTGAARRSTAALRAIVKSCGSTA
jgi:hypothetical protein